MPSRSESPPDSVGMAAEHGTVPLTESTAPAELDRRGRLAFAPAFFGPKAVGGAEMVLGHLARGLQGRGWEVEILTTGAEEHISWKNVFASGVTEEDGLLVRRYPAVFQDLEEHRFHKHAIERGERISIADQERWINSGMRVPDLYHYLLEGAEDYRALVFGPYTFWLAFACSQVAPDRSVLWTCLDDSNFSRLELFQPMMTGVAGLFFQTQPEYELARRLFTPLAPNAEVGCGVEVPEKYDPDGFRERYGIDGPFILYAGRREEGKGWETLLRQFSNVLARASLPFNLVTFGQGTVNVPAEIADRVIDLGFLPDQERDNAFAAADAYVQPSRLEAFSRTIMEAWLAGTLVIANAGSDVVNWHCERSGAGLVYTDELEFEQCLSFLADAPDTAEALARSGRDYVLSNYTWDIVLDNVEQCLVRWTKP